MPLNTTPNRIEYAGNGTSAVFAWPYKVNAPGDLGVMVFNSSGTQPAFITPQFLTTNFTFAGTPDASGIYATGGNIVFNSSPNAQSVIVIFRSSVITNGFSVPQWGPVPATSLNNEVDYLTMLLQRANDLNMRSLRLPDGLPGPVDMNLPSNIRESDGKRLLVRVNTSVISWSFDETLGSYIPNTLIYATTNSSITSLPGAAANLYLRSNGSSAPAWSGIVIDPGSLVGVVPVVNGGTGTGSTWTRGLPIFAGSGGVHSEMTGFYYDESQLTFRIGSGAVSFLGLPMTGPLRAGVGSGIVTVGSTSLVNEVSGLLPTSSGGTNNSNYVQYGIVYAAQSNQLASVPSATAGQVLTAQGSSAPTWGPVSVSLNVSTIRGINGNSSVTIANNMVKISGPSIEVRLYDTLNNSGREIGFLHQGSSLQEAYKIIASGIQRIGRYGTSVTIHTYDQSLGLQAGEDGNWLLKESKTITQPERYSALLTGFGTVGSSTFVWHRSGNMLYVNGAWTNGTVAAVTASIQLPPNLSIDPASATRLNATGAVPGGMAGAYGFNDAGNYGCITTAVGSNATLVYFGGNTTAATILNSVNGNAMSNTGTNGACNFSVPILGWLP